MACYLITGGLGFIGGHLADSLRRAGDEVRILDDLSTGRRENVPAACDVRIGDVADAGAVADAMAGVDGCFHLAAIASVAQSNRDWAACHRVNLGGTVNVLEAARDGGGVPVVYASSAAVYGDQTALPLSEKSAVRPMSPYGVDKFGGELHAAVATRIHGVPTAGLRFFNVYGPRQDPNSPYSGVISIFAKKILNGESVTIHGDGGQSRDFVFVADAVAFLCAAMASPGTEPRVLNVCTGQGTTVSELFDLLCELGGCQVSKEQAPLRTGDIRTSLGDPACAQRVLGVAAEISLRDGLQKTLAASELVQP